MIPERTAISVDSTVEGESIALSIDQSALAHIMNVLTDLYEDAELACIREYSTNALDSHIEAGQSRPIEVTTPTDLRPLLTIRDYGVGLDADDIRNIYSRYGASTKRQSNDAVGMLGLGCKSALAFVDQFTLTGIKDGNRIQVSIARDESGAAAMTVLESGETDEPNGAEVSIPATGTSIEAKAIDFFRYWQPGTVLLNGEAPNALEGYAVSDYIVAERVQYEWEGGRLDHLPLAVVMGNVAYPAPQGYNHAAVDSLPDRRRIVVEVPIGAVNFTPSREGLQDSARTRKAIDDALESFQTEVGAAAKDAITGAPDRPAAARALIEARDAFGKDNIPELTWHGEEIPTVLSAEDLDPLPGYKPGETRPASLWAARKMHTGRGGEGIRSTAGQISLDEAGKWPWILGYSNAKWSAPQRRKLNRYLEHHGLNDDPRNATIYITDAKAVPRPEWIDGAVTTIEWQDVREWKDPEGNTGGGYNGGGVRYAGTYPTMIEGRWVEKYEAEDLADVDPRHLYYVTGGKWTTLQSNIREILSDDAVIVCLTDTRAAKFKRLFPKARDGHAVARKAANGWFKSQSDERKRAIALGLSGAFGYGSVDLGDIDPETVSDPELSTLLRARALWDGNLEAAWNKRSWLIDAADTPDEIPDSEWDDVYDRYPLAQNLPRRNPDCILTHVTLYVNAVYAANESED